MAPRIALGEVTLRLALLLFLAAPSNLGFPNPVMRLLLLLEAALPLCELTEPTLLLLLPPKPCIRLCTSGTHCERQKSCNCKLCCFLTSENSLKIEHNHPRFTVTKPLKGQQCLMSTLAVHVWKVLVRPVVHCGHAACPV